jgi:cation diffusion facilitator family transporter
VRRARRSKDSTQAVLVALGANLAIAVAKFIAAAASASSALLAEAIHSCVDTVDQALLLLGTHRARRPPDRQHPFGHGQEAYFWSLIVSVLIFAVGGGMSLWEGLDRLRHRTPLEAVGWSYAVLGVAAIFEGSSFAVAYRKLSARRRGRSLWRTFRESKDPALLAVVFEDSTAVVGLLLAFLGLFLGTRLRAPALDGVASLGIGALLICSSALLARETRSLLLGEAASDRVVGYIHEVLDADPAVRSAGPVLTMHFGPDEILVNMDVRFRASLTAGELERAVDRIEERIRARFPEVTRIFIEMDSHADRGGFPEGPPRLQ